MASLGSFERANQLVNSIHAAARDTILNNLHGMQTGTPGWNIMRGPIPSWDAATSVLPWDLYAETSDLRLLANMYDTQHKLVDYTGTFFTPDTHIYANPNNPLLAEYALPRPEGPFVMPAWARPDFVPPPPGPGDHDSVASAYHYLMIDRLASSAAHFRSRSRLNGYIER